MNDLAQLLCVVVSLTGGIHCIALLRNSRKQAESTGELAKSPPTSARWKLVCARINRYCQVLLATTFIAVAASMLAILAYRVLPPLWEENPLDEQIRRSMETVLLSEFLPVIVKYDPNQPSNPVIGIECHSKLICDDQVRRLLRQAPKLVWLNLADTDVSDNALCDLDCVPGLCEINLTGTQIGDVGVRHLAKLKNLEGLYLDDTSVTDNGLRFLASVRSLRTLSLLNTAVTDASLDRLGSLDGLEVLGLRNTGASDEGIARLKHKLPGVIINSQRN